MMEVQQQQQQQQLQQLAAPGPPGLPPDHPLLRGAQAALKQQQQQQLQQLQHALQQQKVEQQKVDRQHEETGKQLYEEQQKLKRLKARISQVAEEEKTVKQRRAASEEALAAAAQALHAETAAAAAATEQLAKAREDLNELNFVLQKAQGHTQKLEDAIKLKRRETYKEAAAAKAAESLRLQQDRFLNKLNNQVFELNELKDLLTVQIKAQEEDKQNSKNAIQETQREIEEIAAGKKQLRIQLGSCMQGLERRAAAEIKIKKEIENQNNKLQNATMDTREVERLLQDLQEENENLTSSRNSISSQVAALKQQTELQQQQQQQLQQQLMLLAAALEKAEKDNTQTERLNDDLRRQREAAARELQNKIQKRNLISEKIFETIANQESIARASTAHHKETKQLLSECKKKEEELIKIEFDAAQLQLERVGLQAAAAAAAAEASAVEADIAEKENLLDQFKAEIRKGHIRISRKEMLVDQLNREYDAKRSAHGDESSGLLDGTIRQLRNKLTQNTQDIAHLQQAWVQKQTDLLNLQTKISEKKEEVAAKKDEILIRQQRSQRVAAAVSSSKKELAKLQGELRAQQQLAERVQRQLAAFKQQQQQQQQEANAAAEENRLKLQQKLAAKEALLQSIKKTEAERERSLEETLNLEREIALWEEKIKLEKEMQQAVDPNLGQAELAAMRREIRKMEIKEIQIKKTQELLLKELLQLLAKRESLCAGQEPKRKTNELQQKYNLERQIKSIELKLKEAEEKGNKIENELEASTSDLTQVEESVATLKREIKEAEEKTKETEEKMETEKVRLLFEKGCLVQIQRLVKDLSTLTDEEIQTNLKPSIELALHKVQSEAASVASAIEETEQEMQQQQPHLKLFRAWALHLAKASTADELLPQTLNPKP